ncbi:MAG: OB-fold putative lipoprotein [Bacteroidia bacterium]|nr:OB-fold putative lipoprotein [Bacteroidia bacterium]
MSIDKKKKIRKIILLTILFLAIIGVSVGYYLWNMPHIDVQAQKADVTIDVTSIVNEYLQDEKKANDKYLSAEGDSKIFVVKGVVKSKDTDMNNQITVLLQGSNDKAGVKCVFMAETNKDAEILQVGQTTSIKGIIRSGAKYDSDLELYENVLLEKCDVVKE